MIRVYLILVLVIFGTNLFSQPWTKNLPQDKTREQLTFTHYKDAFNQYWAPYNVDKGYYIENGKKIKASGWKQFKRWEYYMEKQINPSTNEFPKQTANEVYKDYLKVRPALKSVSLTNQSNWTSLGPTTSTGGYAGIGRLNCIAFHPTDNNTYWVGAASGGLWVTTNNGSSWSCLTDNNGVLAISDILIPTDFATSNTIYIATGDKDGWDNNSVGVLKSVDGGITWNTTGISYLISAGKMVTKLLVDPADNQTLLAATTNGVYKTTDGGTTWSTRLTTTSFIDLEYKPGDFNTLYGSTTSGSIYVSSNGGTNWTQSFTDANARRIDLSVSANQPALVYGIAANSANGLYGIYKSTDSGATYTQVFAGTTKNLMGWNAAGDDLGGQGWYDLSIAASPTNANTLLIGGINTWRSIDGGITWAIVNYWTSGAVQTVHADKHMLKYRSGGNIFECNDGGVYLSANDGTSWTVKTNGIVISQMYKLGVAQTTNNETITGLQDNGTKLVSGGTWSDKIGGDGMECLIDYSNINNQYGELYYGEILGTTNHWGSSATISNAIPGGFANTGAWVTPFVIDPVNPQTLYVGYADIWKTTDRGGTWTKISSMNTSNKIRSMAVAPSNTQVMYVANQSVIWKTPDNGTTWTTITGTLPVGTGSINYITVKNDDENTLWVTLGGYSASRVYQSINGGTTWTDISAGLPSLPVYTLVQNKQVNYENQLYVGTELGIYFKKGTDNWIAFNTGLPNVSIGEIEIYYAANPQNSKLRAATYGRGLWESPVHYSSVPMTYTSSTTTQNNSATVIQSAVNQEIVGIQVVADGDLTPLSATSFTFNTTGSTNPSADISNAKVYYTGSTNTFATSAQFGSASISPDGPFTISGTQVLAPGTNYFWLTYDVQANPTVGDVLDAQCTSLTVGTQKTPSVTNPAGTRIIAAVSYCTAGATSAITTYPYISNFKFATINQTSARGAGGYQDFTPQTTTMQIGVNYAATISITNHNTRDQILIWIDWNRDGDFTDSGENVYVSGTGLTTPYTTSNFTPPAWAIIGGATRMRIRLNYTGTGTNVTSCGTSTRGEVEDYTINVIAAPCTPPSAPTGTTPQTFCSGSSHAIADLTATGSGIKWYAAETGGAELPGSTTLVNNTHYFAGQTVSACESTSRFDVLVTLFPDPTAPAIGAITQPTCTTATGSVILNDLPASGSWVVRESLTNSTITGTGTTGEFQNLSAGTYSFAVTDGNGCHSTASENAVINGFPTPSENKQLIVSVFLEGVFNTVTGLMNTTLNDNLLIPKSQPYTTAPWNYGGTESVSSVPADVVDWVLVELRHAPTPAEALPATILSGWPRAYFLKSDGTVVDLDGTSLPTIGNPQIADNLYVVIRHRNHISVMSGEGLTSNCDNYTFNFTDAITKAYGSSDGYKQIKDGVFGMVCADTNSDGSITVLDFTKWATDFGQTAVYIPSDINEDGGVTVLDFTKWATNFGIGNIVPLKSLILPDGQIPKTYTYKSQVPGMN